MEKKANDFDSQIISVNQNSCGDLFDLLTDNLIITEILLRLDTIKSIARLSLASKRLHSLCRFTPVMFLHDTESITDDTAFFLNVPELTLKISPHVTKSLVLLTLPFLPLMHLKILRLEHVFLQRNFHDWISQCCVNLQELYLINVNVGVFAETAGGPMLLNITSPCLRVLTIDAHLRHLHVHVSAPKLVKLNLTWNLSCYSTASRDVRPFESYYYYHCSDLRSNLPCLQSASITFSMSKLSVRSFDNFFRDNTQIKSLQVNYGVIHQISLRGDNFPVILDKLENLDISVATEKSSERSMQTSAIISFLEKVPSLKILTITTVEWRSYYDNESRKQFLPLLVNNISKYGISKPVIRLDDNTTKIELSQGEDATELIRDIPKYASRDNKFIISYPS